MCAIAFAFSPCGVSADPTAARAEIEGLLPGLSDMQIDELLEQGELSNFISPDEGPLLVPGPGYAGSIADDLESIEYTIGVEVLNLILGDYRGFTTTAAANLLLEVSTLEGLEYYSASREKMRTLFVQSYVIDSPVSENRIADPAIGGAPAKGSVTIFQEDKTFGKNKLTLAYEVTGSTIHMVTRNITRFTWGLIPLIKPEYLRMHVLIFLTDSFIIYYGNFGAKAVRLSLLEKRIFDSFYNRLIALSGWFERKLPED